MKNLDLIEKYLSEELTPAEQEQFEKLKKTDADFAEEIQMAAVVNADFNIQQKMRWKSLLEKQNAPAKDTPVRKLAPRKKSYHWIRSVAAVFVLGLGLAMAWMFFSTPDLDVLASEQLVNIYKSPTVTMDGAVVDSHWKNAINAYQDGNFSIAVAAIEKSIENTPENLDEKHFYLGLSYLYEDVPDYQKAVNHLLESKKLNAQRFAPQADWFLSLAYLKQGKTAQAKALLQHIVDRNGWKKAEAKALL
ncbi:MAG TPA: hypothetical protein ENJ53_08290 [Phaeodactylibacter sp.]|nr:hypothetical protein [Phaeodactylibacter sp.]